MWTCIRLKCQCSKTLVTPYYFGLLSRSVRNARNSTRYQTLSLLRTLPKPSWVLTGQTSEGITSSAGSLFNHYPSLERQTCYLSSTPQETGQSGPSTPKPSLYQRFKSMARDYWYVLIPVHVVTSCIWFGGFFYAASSGLNIADALQILNLSDEIMDKIRHSANSTAGHVTLSYLLYKIFTPLRYTVTLGGTTYSIKYLTARGLLKKMPRKEEIGKMVKKSWTDKLSPLKKNE